MHAPKKAAPKETCPLEMKRFDTHNEIQHVLIVMPSLMVKYLRIITSSVRRHPVKGGSTIFCAKQLQETTEYL